MSPSPPHSQCKPADGPDLTAKAGNGESSELDTDVLLTRVAVERTAQANRIRGLLTEFGLVVPVGIRSLERKLPDILEDAENGSSGVSRALFARLLEHFRALDRQVVEREREINARHREDAASQRLQAIPGIGPLTASALVRALGMRECSITAVSLRHGSPLMAWTPLLLTASIVPK